VSEIQVCEGVFRQKCGRYVAVIPCERREGGQLWTDGIIHYFNDGTVTFAEGGSVVDLVEYIGPFLYSSQCAPVSRPAETESTTAVAGGVSEDPGRIIYELEEKLKTANATTDRLRTELEQSQGVRTSLAAEIERLQAELNAVKADAYRQLRTLQESHEKLSDRLLAEQRGEREGFRIAISIILEARS